MDTDMLCFHIPKVLDPHPHINRRRSSLLSFLYTLFKSGISNKISKTQLYHSPMMCRHAESVTIFQGVIQFAPFRGFHQYNQAFTYNVVCVQIQHPHTYMLHCTKASGIMRICMLHSSMYRAFGFNCTQYLNGRAQYLPHQTHPV